MDYELSVLKEGFRYVIGIDEAGRGPLAGPVVAAAVIIHDGNFKSLIRDSKKMTLARRETAFCEILDKASVGIGVVCEAVIDQVNILNATFIAMNRAVDHLLVDQRFRECPETEFCILVDGNRFINEGNMSHRTIVRGDDSVLSIQCASIVAKVTRDRILKMYDQIFPQYGFQSHKGYPTARHREAIEENGLSPIHRRSFTFNRSAK